MFMFSKKIKQGSKPNLNAPISTPCTHQMQYGDQHDKPVLYI